MSYRDHGAKVWGCLGVIVLFASLPLIPMAMVNMEPEFATLPRPFNSASWKQAAKGAWDDDSRCGMILDLQHRVGLEGRRRAEVEDMLGAPENERVEPGLSHWHLCPSFMDIWILEVRWRDGRVANAMVRDT